jgi:multiple sugar transport system permease protein
VNTYWALIVPPMFSAYGVFMLRQFFLTLPRELGEAAMIDGCSPLGIYWRVVLPLSRPALAALAILTFIGTWRSFMWPLIVTHTPDLFTLPLALARYQEMHGVQWPYLMAGSVILVLPMLVVFIIGQRFFVAGIQIGAVKG